MNQEQAMADLAAHVSWLHKELEQAMDILCVLNEKRYKMPHWWNDARGFVPSYGAQVADALSAYKASNGMRKPLADKGDE